MMRKLYAAIFIFVVFAASASAQELFVRNDKYFTEVYLKLDLKDIRSVEKRKDSVVVYFLKNIRAPFDKKFDDRFVKSVRAAGNMFTVNLDPGAEFAVVNDVSGIKIVASKRKTDSDILSSYGIGKPLLSKDSSVAEDKAQEDALNEADRLITAKQFAAGAQVLNNILASSKNDFYRQEAFYRLGQTYMLMSQYNDEYLVNAYSTFDDFVKLYPDNFRASDAMMKSAEAKEQANQLFEAIFAYGKIYDSVPDLESKRVALTKMAELYAIVGQLDKAVDMYKTYLKQFRSESGKINGNIGQIYYDQKELDLAFEYFSSLDLDSVINDPDTDVKRLFSIAKTMETKKRYDPALKLYAAIYEKTPDAPQSNEAILNSASILQKTGRNPEADKLLLRLKELFPDRLSGQQATVEYAKKYLNTKPYSYWNDFFADLLSREDLFGFRPEAEYMLIKAMYRENDMDRTIPAVETFLARYPESPYNPELDKIREDFTFTKAAGAFTRNDFAAAEPLLLKFNSDYPKSSYRPRTDSMLTDIAFGKAQKAYEENRYKDAIKAAESHIAGNPSDGKLKRWFDLLDAASYKNLGIIYASDDFPAARVNAREYLASFPEGRYAKPVSDILEGALRKPAESLYKNGDYQGVIKLYEANGDWLQTWPNKAYADDIRALAGLSVYKLGSPSKAGAIYSEITPNKTVNYAILGLVSGDKNLQADVNAFDGETFEYVVGEVERLDTDAALSLIKRYTTDPKLAARLEYGIAKNIPSDAKRQEVLMDVYETVNSNESARFEGSEDVHLDIGLLYFRKNDFKSAVEPLKRYTDLHKINDDKRAEALYYLGKSFVGMNDPERGRGYYEEIIQTVPESIYAGIAKNELEENAWKKSLDRF